MTPDQEQEIGRCIFREANDAIFIVDPATLRFLEVNPAAQRLTGLRRKQLLELSIPDIISSTSGVDLSQLIHACKTTAAFTASDGYKITLQDQSTRDIHVSVSRIHTEQGPLGLLVVRDISKLRKAESERRELEMRMMQSQKLESLGILAGGIAHDFNNILTSILGFADLAMFEVPNNSAAKRHVEQVLIGARRAADLTNQMLAYSGRSKFTIGPVQLTELVDELCHLLAVSISKKCTLQFEFSRGLPSILADASQIRQIIMNLLINASEAIGDNIGCITVRTMIRELPSPRVFGAHQPDEIPAGAYVCLEVQDTGCGMNAVTKARIFDPFFSTKVTGRGLGLAAVLGIVRGHRGAIEIESSEGKGTLFRVYFPASDLPVEAAPPNYGEMNGWRGTGLIVVIDDEESIRDLAESMLRKLGFEVRTAKDGLAGLELIESIHSPIRAVLLDLCMPRLDGEGTLRELRLRFPDLPVLILSGYGELLVNERIPESAHSGFVKKPFRLSDLMLAIRRAVGD